MIIQTQPQVHLTQLQDLHVLENLMDPELHLHWIILCGFLLLVMAAFGFEFGIEVFGPLLVPDSRNGGHIECGFESGVATAQP